MASLRGIPLGRACYLTRQAGLRVSEVCRLRSKDMVLEGQPYLIIQRSKRGRSRRVSLEHLPPAHLERQRKHQEARLRKGGMHYLAQADEQPLVPKAISEGMGEALKEAGLEGAFLDGHDVVPLLARCGCRSVLQAVG